AQLCRCGSGRPHKVGLDCSGDEYRIGTLRERRTEVEFQLPGLVAAESKSGEIVALDKHLDAELAREPREGFDRRRSRLQWRARILVDHSENAHRLWPHIPGRARVRDAEEWRSILGKASLCVVPFIRTQFPNTIITLPAREPTVPPQLHGAAAAC